MTEQIHSSRAKGGADLRSPAGCGAARSGACAAIEGQRKLSSFSICDNWPAVIPVTKREIEVIETYMGDVLDALLAQCKT